MTEANGHYTIKVADLTLKQLDDIQRLVSTYKWGSVVATTYVYLKAQDPSITREKVAALRSGDVTIIRDPNDTDTAERAGTGEDDDPLGPG